MRFDEIKKILFIKNKPHFEWIWKLRDELELAIENDELSQYDD